MSEAPGGDRGLDALIRGAKGDAPDRARLDRVRAKLEAELGPLGPGPGPATAPPDGASASPGPTLGSAWGPIALAVLVLAGAAIGWLAWRGRAPDVEAIAPGSAASDDPRGPRSSEASAASAGAAGVAGEREPQRAVEAQPERGDAREPEAPAAERELASDRGGARPARGARRAAEGRVALDPEEPASTLREEIALLDRALRARDAGDHAGARAVLDQHEARFPDGHLAPERERLRAEITRAEAAAASDTRSPAP